jgi:hypothetical protein
VGRDSSLVKITSLYLLGGSEEKTEKSHQGYRRLGRDLKPGYPEQEGIVSS